MHQVSVFVTFFLFLLHYNPDHDLSSVLGLGESDGNIHPRITGPKKGKTPRLFNSPGALTTDRSYCNAVLCTRCKQTSVPLVGGSGIAPLSFSLFLVQHPSRVMGSWNRVLPHARTGRVRYIWYMSPQVGGKNLDSMSYHRDKVIFDSLSQANCRIPSL